MDSLIAASAHALAGGDALGVLKRIALREDPPALALRGIAMAQLGDLGRARELLQQASHGFGPREPLARARCSVAEAEVALARRDLDQPPRTLAAAIDTLQAHGDSANAAHGRVIALRRLLLLGRLGEARAALAQLDGQALPAPLAAVACLAAAELALRAVRTAPAREALDQAQAAATRAGIPALLAEIETTRATLQQVAARQPTADGERALRLADVEALFASGALVVDGCRLRVRSADAWLPLVRRPVLFALVRGLAMAWPQAAPRDALVAEAFRLRRIDETHRARLRVEIGRLRTLLAPWAAIEASGEGFVLLPHDGRAVAMLLPPVDDEHSPLLALLGDGEAWSTTALALALGSSQRTVQRALSALESAGRVRAVGRTRNRRWVAASAGGFATTLLLPASLPAA